MYLKLLALLTLLFSSAVLASRPAIVVSTRAVIYADQELKSPIGYVSAGRKVVVGDVARKNGSILPIIVIGRVAWIKASDLALNTEELKNVTTSRFKVNEEQFKNAEEKFDDNLFENNYAQFSFGSLAVDNSYKEFGETTGYATGDTATALRLHVFHRPPFKKSVWSVGVGYYAQSEEEYEWETVTVEAKYGYSLSYKRMHLLSTLLQESLSAEILDTRDRKMVKLSPTTVVLMVICMVANSNSSLGQNSV